MIVEPPVAEALRDGKPVVALETAVLTHGLPAPRNLETVRQMEHAIRKEGAVPAVIGMWQGQIRVGLNGHQLETLAETRECSKVNLQNLAIVAARGEHGGTTVSATMFAAKQVGIQVLATGGIGGVHLHNSCDVSNDILALAEISMLVVCSGPKAVLDIESTMELLETHGVPVLGYQTDFVPAFYSADSGVRATASVSGPQQVVEIMFAHHRHGLRQAILLCQPPPEEVAIPKAEIDAVVHRAVEDAYATGISGRELTPYLLRALSDTLDGRPLEANCGLLVKNARLAGRLAKALSQA